MKWFVVAGLLIMGLFSGLNALAQDEGEIITISGQAVQIMPLSVVTESEVQILDVTDTRARVNFVSTDPLACYLVYGTDERFGFVTNDPNMSQVAIVDHNPILLNLRPDTEYVFRMQGIGEDGVMYFSDLYRFRTLPASDEISENLLSPENGARVIEVSSNFGNQPNDGRWGILNAFDGNPATEWSSNGDGDEAYFIVELGDLYHISTIEYRTRAMNDGTAITESFTVTIDNGETFGPFALEDYSDLSAFEVDFETRTLRFDVEESTGGNTGIIDIAAYGTPVIAR